MTQMPRVVAHLTRPHAIVVVVLPHHSELCLVADAFRAGARDLVVLGVSDPMHLISRLTTKVAPSLTAMCAVIRSHVGATAESLALAMLLSGGTNVKEVAHRLGISRRGLNRQCAQARLPSPGTLLRWARAIRAAELLSEEGWSLARTARILGYSSARSISSSLAATAGIDRATQRVVSTHAVLNAFADLLRSRKTTRTGPVQPHAGASP